MRNFYIKIIPLIILILFSYGHCQLPIDVNHPSQIIIKRYSALGDIPLEYFGKNSVGAIDGKKILSVHNSEIIKIHKRDIQIAEKDSNSSQLMQ